MYSISYTAHTLSVSAHTLRFWEKKKLIFPKRDPVNGYREYSDNDLLTLRFIICFRSLGYSLDDCKIFITKGTSKEKIARIYVRAEGLLQAKYDQIEMLVKQIAALKELEKKLKSDGLESPPEELHDILEQIVLAMEV